MSQLTKISDVHAADKISSVTDEGAPWGVESDLPETGNTVLPVLSTGDMMSPVLSILKEVALEGVGGDLPRVSVTETFNEKYSVAGGGISNIETDNAYTSPKNLGDVCVAGGGIRTLQLAIRQLPEYVSKWGLVS